MTGVILAAGKGSRLGPITEKIPKSLLELSNQITLLEYNLNILQKLNTQNIFIITGFLTEKIEKLVIEKGINAKCIYNPFWEHCNVLGSLYMSLPYISDDFLFLHADTLVDFSVWEKLVDMDGDIILPYKKKNCGIEEMKIKHTSEGKLKHISKEIDAETSDGEFLGIAKFCKEMVPYIQSTAKKLFMKGNLNQYMEAVIQEGIYANKNIRTFEIGEAPFVEVDFPEDYRLAQKLFAV